MIQSLQSETIEKQLGYLFYLHASYNLSSILSIFYDPLCPAKNDSWEYK